MNKKLVTRPDPKEQRSLVELDGGLYNLPHSEEDLEEKVKKSAPEQDADPLGR